MMTLERGKIADRTDVVGLLRGTIRAFGELTIAERRKTSLLLASTLVNSVLSFVGIAGVLPFFQLMVEPDPLAHNKLLGRAFSAIGPMSTYQAIVISGMFFVFLIGLKNFYAIFHARLINRFCSGVETRVATDTLARIVQAPFSWYLRQNTSILRDVITAHVVEWSRGVLRPALNLANSGFMLLSAIMLIVPLTPGPAILTGVCIVSIGGGFIALSRSKLRQSGNRKKRSGLLAGVAAAEAIGGGRDVRISPAGKLLVDEFHREYATYAYADADSRQWQLVPRLGIEVFGIAALVAIALVMLASGADRTEAASILALYAIVTVRLLPVIGEVTNSIASIQVSLPQLTHLQMLREELPPANVMALNKEKFSGWLKFELKDVSYRYSNAAGPALENVNLTFERGQSYGLIGASGSGKSTIADIVASLLIPTTGTLAIDGVAVSNAESCLAWRSRVAYVAQQPVIFDATLADNIVLGAPADAGREERLNNAIAVAGLTSVVQSLEAKENTHIGDRGTRLSGGQRQRVAIARAIFQQAELLILDEATSALDSLTELEFASAMDNLKGKITILAIAHRLSTVMRCNEIFVLDCGRVVAHGPHDQLMARSVNYRRFVESQSMNRGLV